MHPKRPSRPSGGDGITPSFPAARVSRECISLGVSLAAVVEKSQHSVLCRLAPPVAASDKTAPQIPHPYDVLWCHIEVSAVPSRTALEFTFIAVIGDTRIQSHSSLLIFLLGEF